MCSLSLYRCINSQDAFQYLLSKPDNLILNISVSGNLLSAALDDIVTAVLSIEEFSVDDCEYLQRVLTVITEQARDIYLLEGVDTNPEVLLHEHVTSWFRFKELLLVLGFGLQQISDRWADGKGPLAMHFSPSEVQRLVLGMFENTSKRDVLLGQIKCIEPL